jgi:hypothetical protein
MLATGASQYKLVTVLSVLRSRSRKEPHQFGGARAGAVRDAAPAPMARAPKLKFDIDSF